MIKLSNANLYCAFKNNFPEELSKILLSTQVDEYFSYHDAEEQSARVANLLVKLGLKAGDRVSVQVEKSPQMLWLYLGVIRAGMVFHPLNTAYTSKELDYFIRNAEPALVVCDPKNQSELALLCESVGVPIVLTLDSEGTGTLRDQTETCADEFETYPSRPDDLAALLYSSGTTGRPKGIMLTHKNLTTNATTLVNYWGFTSNDCLLHALPIFHVHGLFVAISCALMSGASMRWLPRFDARAVIENLANTTVMMGVPTYYTRLLAESDFTSERTENMRLFVSGSAPLLAETFTEFENRTGHRILERYGMSETGMNTSNPLMGERRAGTVGAPLPGVEVRITDSENNLLPIGSIGDLQIRGENVFLGYWKMPEKTAEDFTEDKFFITGDKAQIDNDGYISIVGREKDMIICGGLNVYPKEIELLIDKMAGISESAVIGLPDADFGEIVAAVVVCEKDKIASEQNLIGHLKTLIANFKVPKKVFFVDELPRNTMGKVQKNVLRETYS